MLFLLSYIYHISFYSIQHLYFLVFWVMDIMFYF